MGYKIVKRCLLVLLACLIVLNPVICVQAYDFNAPHEVNTGANIEENKKKIWNFLRSKGYSEECTAGIMGGIEGECGFDCTAVQGFVPFGPEFASGSWRGVGLAQWTQDRQLELFAKADEMGKQWTDLKVQLEFLLYELEVSQGPFYTVSTSQGSFSSLEEFKNSTDIPKVVAVYVRGFERAGSETLERRVPSALAVFEQFTGTEITEEGSDENKEEGGEEDKFDSLVGLVKEDELVGMPSSKGIASDLTLVELPDPNNLSTSDKMSVSEIKSDILDSRDFKIWDTIRLVIVFIGLLVIMYSILLLVCFMFDRVNVIFDISLVSLISLGILRYSDEEKEKRIGYLNTPKVLKSSALAVCIGFFLISGKLFTIVLDLVYFVSEVF